MADDRTRALLEHLRRDMEALARTLKVEAPSLAAWTRVLDVKLLPRLDPDFPLIAAICGGGSSGKSTLFNTLVRAGISPTGGRAGMNRRILMALHEETALRRAFLLSLYAPFDAAPEPLTEPDALKAPGPPLYMADKGVPRNLILFDTPDFDTGAQGTYMNRQEARKALEAADLFIYIFTNATYNNRDNTDFISRMLTGIGMRKAFLVYRVYPGFTDAEVCEHAMTVARNIYGEDAESQILGIYRADENNAVAEGKAFPSLRPAHTRYPPFHQALEAVDPLGLRESTLTSILTDALRKARSLLEALEGAREALSRYTRSLKDVQETQIRQSLRHFPADRLMKRFLRIWTASDPPLIRTLRKTGHLLESPFQWLAKVTARMRPSNSQRPRAPGPLDFESQVTSDLLFAAHDLFSSALSEYLHVPGENRDPGIPAPPAVLAAQKALSAAGWKRTRDALLARKETLFTLSNQLDDRLAEIADDFRKQMGSADRIRQYLSAALNILPATLAVTYILHTGNPAGAVGIKVKLAHLLRSKDLYALLAIPATAGFKAADMKQLRELLRPLVQTWFKEKRREVERIFEDHITGEILACARDALSRSASLIAGIEKDLGALEGHLLEQARNKP